MLLPQSAFHPNSPPLVAHWSHKPVQMVPSLWNCWWNYWWQIPQNLTYQPTWHQYLLPWFSGPIPPLYASALFAHPFVGGMPRWKGPYCQSVQRMQSKIGWWIGHLGHEEWYSVPQRAWPHFHKRAFTVYSADSNPSPMRQGVRCTSLVSLSMQVKMALQPWSSGRLMMKSMVQKLKWSSGSGMGAKEPGGKEVWSFNCKQGKQPAMKCLISWAIPGHQTCYWSASMVFRMLRWPMRVLQCISSRSSYRRPWLARITS